MAGINTEYQNNNIGGWGFLIPQYNQFTIGTFIFNTFKINSDFHLLAGARYDFGILETKSYLDWFSVYSR